MIIADSYHNSDNTEIVLLTSAKCSDPATEKNDFPKNYDRLFMEDE